MRAPGAPANAPCSVKAGDSLGNGRWSLISSFWSLFCPTGSRSPSLYFSLQDMITFRSFGFCLENTFLSSLATRCFSDGGPFRRSLPKVLLQSPVGTRGEQGLRIPALESCVLLFSSYRIPCGLCMSPQVRANFQSLRWTACSTQQL